MYAGSAIRDLEQDPYYQLHQEQMRMMYSNPMYQMYQSPFYGMDPYRMMMPQTQAIEDSRARRQEVGAAIERAGRREMVPHAGADMYSSMMGSMMGMLGNPRGMMGMMQQQMPQLASDPNCQFYSHSSVMSYDGSGGGAPKVYQATATTRQAPGGVRETKRTVRDSERGIEKLAVGHHIQDQAHVISRERDVRSGDVEENQEFVNLEEAEADAFNYEWRQRMSPYSRPPSGARRAIGGHRAEHPRSRLALPDTRPYRPEGHSPHHSPPQPK